MKSLSRANVTQIMEEMKTALDMVAKKHGLVVLTQSARYNAAEVNFKVEVKVPGADADNAAWEKDAKAYRDHCKVWGLPANLVGETIDIHGTKFVFLGMRPRSPQYPFLVRKVQDGKVYKEPVSSIYSALNLDLLAAMKKHPSVSAAIDAEEAATERRAARFGF